MPATVPLVSIVIPTCGRPQYLPRAVESALTCQGDSVEVIVVPNGPDESWKKSLSKWVRDSRVLVSPIAPAHGNVARNHGMALARGKYLRFLDDDDYLLPPALDQLTAVMRSGVEISVGGISMVSAADRTVGERIPPQTDDFAQSVLTMGHTTLLHAYLYRREAIGGMQWDENTPFSQDKQWLYALCKQRDWTFTRMDDAVGVWFQHDGARVSQTQRKRAHAEAWATLLWDTIVYLRQAKRLSSARREAAVNHLWRLICGAYHLDPGYWSEVTRNTLELAPDSRPDLFIYRNVLTEWLPPMWLLRGFMPLQHIRRLTRITLRTLGLRWSVVRP